ncbi:hypothetical protein BG015_009806 [Linnemannia schmuckeri]|uniref:F-box domain-containing protein n=1 Tax=Linnemannia schmuckeri TaxID=64567 RepID=A0A9P5RUX8_9FUNG|nr:hypothetical protein BG015_009806 [Linnemannia schmuckeri]
MTIAQFPDVLHLLAPHLNTYDLIACLQVNTLWNSIFIAYLWRTIDDSQRPWRRLLAQFTYPVPTFYHPQEQIAQLVERVPERLLDLFVKYGHHIRRLVIRRPQTVELCLRARAIAQQVQRQQIEDQARAQNSSASSIDVVTQSPFSARDDREVLPCEGITVLRFGFLSPVLTFLKRLDRADSPETPYLTALSATLRRNQQELEPSLAGVHPCVFYQEHDAEDSKLHMITLARSCWQLVLNNPQLQELDMGPFGAHEDTFIVSGRFLKTTLASRQRLRAVRIGVERTTDFLVRLPTTLPHLKMLWYYDKSPAGFNALVESVAKAHGSETENGGKEIIGGVTSGSDGTERMPNLRLFDIVAPTQPRHLKAIFISFPALAMLSIGTLSSDDKGATHRSTAITKTHRDGTSQASAQELATVLRELHVARWDCPPTTLSSINIRFNAVARLNLQLISGYKNLLDLLRTFPALQELQLKKVRDLAEEAEVNYTSEPFFPALKSIRLAKEAFSTPYSLNGLLSILPNLIEANLYTVCSQILASIVEHCPRIEILEFTKKPQYNTQIGLLLTSCTNLKSCVGPGLEIPFPDILNKPWVCKNLQKLDCAITGIPYLTEVEQTSIKNLQSHFSKNITFPLTFDMPRVAKRDPSYTDEDNWHMWHYDEKSVFRQYLAIRSILCDVFDAITKYTDLDTVQQDWMPLSSFTRTLWTSSKRGRPVSSMGRPLKATSRVLSESQARWIHLPS